MAQGKMCNCIKISDASYLQYNKNKLIKNLNGILMKTKLVFLVMAILFALTSCQKEDDIQMEISAVDSTINWAAPINDLNDDTNNDDDYPYYFDQDIIDPNHPFMIATTDIADDFVYYANPIYSGSLGTPSNYEWTIKFIEPTTLNVIFVVNAYTPKITVINSDLYAHTLFKEGVICEFSLNAIYENSPYNGDLTTEIKSHEFIHNTVVDIDIPTHAPLQPQRKIDFCFIYYPTASTQACNDLNIIKPFLANGTGMTANFILP